MPATRFKNNARSTLFSGISNVATTMSVQPGHGDRFPVADINNIFYLTLEDAAKNYEIVKCTARAAGVDVLTITRAQEGTTARSFIAGAIVSLRATAGQMELALNAQANLDVHAAAADPHPQYATDADLTAHAAAADPHTQYLTPAEAALAYAALGHTHQTGAETWGGTTTGTGAAYSLTLTPVVTSITAGMSIRFIAHTANTVVNPTIDIDGAGAIAPITITKLGGQALAVGEIGIGQVIEGVFNTSTTFEITSVTASSSGGGISGETTYNVNTTLSLSTDHTKLIRCTVASVVYTFPAATGSEGKYWWITNQTTSDTGVRLVCNGAESIGGATGATIYIPAYTTIGFVSDGTNWLVFQYSGPRKKQYLAAGNWYCPPGIYNVVLSGCGGGGGGGGADIDAVGFDQGGGGASGYIINNYQVSVVPGTNYAVAIGAGGAGAAGAGGGGSRGSSGGVTSIGALLSIAGGLGGHSTGSSGGANAEGSLATNPFAPQAFSVKAVVAGGGGYGPLPPTGNANGNNAVANGGGGGSGACNPTSTAGSYTGGTGGSGYLIVELN